MSARGKSAKVTQKSSIQKAAQVQAERNARVTAAFAGAGSAADREQQITLSNSKEKASQQLQAFERGTLKLSQAEFDRNVAISRGFLDPITGKPSGKTQSSLSGNFTDSLLRDTPLDNLKSTSSNTSKSFVNATTKSKSIPPALRQIFSNTNPTGTAPAISNPDRFNNFTVTKPFITGNSQIDKVFEGQRQTTILLAQEFQKRRNEALAQGKTINEANQEAKEFVGLSKDLQSGINTALQTDIIQQRASALDEAEKQIKAVTTGQADSDTIKNLGDFVTNVKGTKIQKINIQTDADGKDLSPRKSKLQIENALLTGSKFEDITFNIDVDDRIKTGKSASNPDDSITIKDALGNVTISTERLGKFISPSALQVGLQEKNPLSFLLSQAEISPELQKQSPLFGGDGGQESEFVDSPVGLTPSQITGEEGQSGFDVSEQNGEVVIVNGETETFRGTQQEALEFITNLINSANASGNEKLQGQLATLRETVSKGESISLLLEQVLNILSSLSIPNASAASGQESPDSISNISQSNPIDSFFGFINNIIDAVIGIVSPKN